METPIRFLQSMIFGDFVNLKQENCEYYDLMIHLFQPKTQKLEPLGIYRVSMQQMIEMQGNLDKTKRDKPSIDEWVQYFNKFVQNFEQELTKNCFDFSIPLTL